MTPKEVYDFLNSNEEILKTYTEIESRENEFKI